MHKPNFSVFIIAEIGVNHNGSLEMAKQLVDIACSAGANAVKFQTYKSTLLSSPLTPKTNYQLNHDGNNSTHLEMLRRLELSESDFFSIAQYCSDSGIQFISTPYDIPSAKFLHDELNISCFKVASADIVDRPLLEYIATTHKQIILSTGMASLGEIESAFNIFSGCNSTSISLLHCVSNYPCTDQSLNLRAIKTLRSAFRCPVGFSDHSLGSCAAVASVALGATIIEKHITISRSLDGPDHSCSLEPQDFTQYVADIRRTEVMLGSSVKSPQPEEVNMRSVSRKSLHARHNIEDGQVIQVDDLYLSRPGTGICYDSINLLLGRRATRFIPEGDLLLPSDV